jgi:hypothetical protein
VTAVLASVLVAAAVVGAAAIVARMTLAQKITGLHGVVDRQHPRAHSSPAPDVVAPASLRPTPRQPTSRNYHQPQA